MDHITRGFSRANSVHLKKHALDRLTHIAGQVGDRDQRDVHPIGQSIGRDLPVTVFVRLRLEHVAINVHRHQRKGLRGARNHWRGVVGDAVFVRCARVVLGIMQQLRRGLCGSLCVNGDSRPIHTQLIASRIDVGVGWGVGAIDQLPTFRHLDKPIAVVVGHRAVCPAIQLDHNHKVSLPHVTRQLRQCVAGYAILLANPSVDLFALNQAARTIVQRRCCVHGKGGAVSFRAGVACAICHDDSRRVVAIL